MTDPTQTTQTDTAAEPTKTALIWADTGNPNEQANEARDALAAANSGRHPRVMLFGNALVRLTERGKLEELTRSSMIDELAAVAQFQSHAGEDGAKNAPPPPTVAQILLDRDTKDLPGIPVIKSVSDVPIFVPGSEGRPRLIVTPGLDPESGIYYLPAAGLEDFAFDGTDITTAEVEEALATLRNDLLGDFDIDDDDQASWANVMALTLLPFVRELIPGSTPLFIALAPDVGAGKTELVKTALAPGCGEVPTESGTANGDEMRKRITSSLLAGRPVMFLDNLNELDSKEMANLLTTDTWEDRILGKNQIATLPVDQIFTATGNNLSLSREIARRSYAAFLNPYKHDEKASDRPREKYRHPNLKKWRTENRAQLVHAALTLIQHWAEGPVATVEAGYVFQRWPDELPRESMLTKGSYERWSAVLGGILEQAGVAGFLGNEDRLEAEADDESREAADFFTTWAAALPEPISLADLVRNCGYGMPLHDHLPTDLAGLREENLRRDLSYWLRERKNQRLGGFQLLYDKSARLWSVRAHQGTETA